MDWNILNNRFLIPSWGKIIENITKKFKLETGVKLIYNNIE